MFKMPEIPECLEKRYRALDNLIDELSARRFARNSDASCSRRTDNAGIKLMCDFWNILKDDPDCNLKKEVQQRMGLKVASTHSSFGPHLVTCYMSDRIEKDDKDKASSCCKGSAESKPAGGQAKSQSTGGCSGSSKITSGSDILPLSKVLCSLKDAASFDKKCSERITDLMEAQKRLQEQIHHLEHREKEGAKLLKQADCMWSCMEEAYKKKVAESLDRQKNLLKGLKEAEADVAKWRKSKKELESQLDSVNKCQREITDTTHRKKNDIKSMKTEIEHLKKRIENGKNDKDAASKSISSKKQASDKIVNGINEEILKMQKALEEEKRHKSQKEREGNDYIKEARQDLQKICRVLLQKKLENEDVKAEREALLLEIEMLKQTCDQCQDKCKKNQVSINDEILKVEKDIANFKVKCIKCHECVDTADVRKFCTDCPRCREERDCITEDGHCSADPTNVCVCMSVKHKFMDNVFENMYTVLERQVKTPQGKCLAETVMQSLKRSRNGKIDEGTKKILQEFILCVVKKNLNLTIIGGAVKTRCEMDPETYKQLQLCLKQVKVTRPPKVDKGTIAKKDPCTRWGGYSECNCPGGPKTCICSRKAPPPPQDPKPCPEDPEDKEDNSKREKIICPHKQQSTPCGTDCGMRGLDSLVGTEIAPWVPDPCKEKSCPFSKNMRAAQCVLGPERLSDLGSAKPIIPKLDFQDKAFKSDVEDHPRDRIIEEVMGRYTEVMPIEKVTFERNKGKVKKLERGMRKEDKYRKKRNKRFKVSKEPKKPVPQVFTYAPIFIKNNEFGNVKVSPKMNTIYISNKYYDFWNSDDTLLPDKSCEDININISNNVEFALISNEAAKKCGPDFNYNKSEISRDLNFEECVSVKSIRNSEIQLFRRTVSKDIKQIVKDIIKIDVRAKDINYSSSVEFVTVRSLLKLLVSQNMLNESNITMNENEISSIFFYETLQTETIVKTNKIEASTITDEKVSKTKKGLNQNNGSRIMFDNDKPTREKDVLLKKIYELDAGNTASCSCETANPIATMKLSIRNGNGDIVDYCTELVNTPSGELGIELDDNFFHLIERKASENPNSTAGVLVKDKTGYYTLDFNQKNKTSDDLKIKVKKSSMGSISIILNKKIIEAIKSQGIKSNAIQGTDKLTIEVMKRTDNSINSHKDVTSACSQQKNIYNCESDVVSHLEFLCAEGISNVTLKIIENNDQIKFIKANVLKTASRNIALEVEDVKIINDHLKHKEDGGLLYLSHSNTFLLDFRQSKMNIPRNTIIMKASDKILLIIKDPLQVTKPASVNSKLNYFRLKVKGDDDDGINPPAVLRTTSSHNYLVIVDKEFERKYKETIKKIAKENTLGSAVLSKTLSGEYIISLNKNNDENERDCNAFLLKSASGNIKVIVRGPTFDAIKSSFSRKASEVCILSSKIFEFLKRRHQDRKSINQKQSKLPEIRCNSDSSLFDKSKIQSQESFIKESGSLRKTNSGRYSVVLDKESKKTFVNNLGSYLKKNSNSLIPIKRTDSGGISILLNNQENIKSQYGSLKISPSGNVYVIIDDKEQDTKKENDATAIHGVISHHIIKPVLNPSNKAVATNCYANPLDGCCNYSKCVCEELQNTKSDWFISDQENDSMSYQDNLKKHARVTICNSNNFPRKVDFDIKKEETCSNKSSPHIVIKPCDNCSLRSKSSSKAIAKSNRKSEQCFYVFDSVCPYHKDRYDTVSNELLEISGFCNNGVDIPIKEVETQDFNESKSWSTARDDSIRSHDFDYLDSMPPQLPPFLRDFTIS